MLATVEHISLVVLLLIAAATDSYSKDIYNWTTYPGILLGLGYGLAGGFVAFQESLAGFLVCGGLMLVCFLLFDVGGGDLKLLAMIGAFLGVYQGLEALLWTFLLGSVLAITILVWHFGAWNIIKGFFHHIYLVIKVRHWVPLNKREREPLQKTLFLGPAALVAVLIVLWSQYLPEYSLLQHSLF